MVLISQDGLKAVNMDKIDFFYILPEKNSRGCYVLEAKSPKSPSEFGYYDFLILFEHENLDVVKAVMRFLANGIFFFQRDDDDILSQNILTVDLPDLYKHGMKKLVL